MANMNIAYQIMTDRITKLIETENLCAWTKPWSAEAGMPRNLFSQRHYRGINIWMLGAQGYESPFWATANQTNQAGGSIKPGESPTYVVYWSKYIGKHKETGEPEQRMVLKFFKVWNAAQIQGVAVPSIEQPHRDHTPIEVCEKVAGNYHTPPTITHGHERAYYRPTTDSIAMPDPERFTSASGYYATLFHEMTHSTGHKDRLDRKTLVDAVAYGKVNYAREELVAEMGAAYLCGYCGIENETVDNSAAYLKGWLVPLRSDPKMLVLAAAQAQKAVDHILGVQWREPGQDDE